MIENLDILEKTAVEAAEKAGKFVHDMWLSSTKSFSYKSGSEVVTETDLKSQEILIDYISGRFPDHGILAEEGVDIREKSPYRWIIDPIDGTNNFAHSYPFFCVSVGLEYLGEIVVGAVYDPTREEMFRAVKGKGAFLNKKPMKVSSTKKLTESLLCTGFPYDLSDGSPDNNLKEFCKFAARSQGIRRDGSAAMDLCYVACGRLDGFWEMKLKPWDIAAGSLIVAEAGGKITSYDSGKLSIYGNSVLATNCHIHAEMSDVLTDAS